MGVHRAVQVLARRPRAQVTMVASASCPLGIAKSVRASSCPSAMLASGAEHTRIGTGASITNSVGTNTCASTRTRAHSSRALFFFLSGEDLMAMPEPYQPSLSRRSSSLSVVDVLSVAGRAPALPPVVPAPVREDQSKVESTMHTSACDLDPVLVCIVAPFGAACILCETGPTIEVCSVQSVSSAESRMPGLWSTTYTYFDRSRTSWCIPRGESAQRRQVTFSTPVPCWSTRRRYEMVSPGRSSFNTSRLV